MTANNFGGVRQSLTCADAIRHCARGWRLRSHKHMRTMRSVFTNTGPARACWPRLQETERMGLEMDRLHTRQRLHARRQAGR